MRKVVAVLFLIFLSIITNAAGQTWITGIGSSTTTWDAGGNIGTAAELAQFCYNVNNGRTYTGQTITLTANIDLNGNQWIPIGKGVNTFDGTFDGDGYTISNMTVNEGDDGAGLFGIVNDATIKNVGIVSGSVQGTWYIGAIAGRGNGTTTIEKCFNNVNASGSGELGGIGGRIYGSVTDCYNSGNITSATTINGGSIVGNSYADISNCYNTGDIVGGGIAGYLQATKTISYCVSIGQTVSGTCKRIANGSDGTLSDNYAWDGMTYDNSGTGVATVNGADITKVQVNASTNWSNTWYQSFSTNWEMPSGELPNLKAFASDNVSMPTHLDITPEMNIQGNSTTIADGDATPSTSDYTDFGNVDITNGADTRTFTIQNTGNGDLTFTTPITVTGSGFSCTAQPTSPVAASGSTTFTIEFDPGATGSSSGTVSIANNDGDENPYNFSIQGTGTDISDNSLGNYAIDFDGTDDYVNCGAGASVKINGSAITLEAWIFADDLSGGSWTRPIIDKHGSGGSDGYVLRCGDDGSGGRVDFTIGNGVGFSTALTDNNTLSLGEWNHVAGTYDGSDLKVYINGKLVKTNNIGAKTISIDPANLYIGGGQAHADRRFNGRIDEARVWNDARTAAEIREFMYKDVTAESNLVAYYKMTEGTGTSLTDDSPNGNIGTLTNGPTWTASTAFGGSRQALDFDGTDDYVDCGSPAALDQLGQGSFTLEAWINIDVVDTRQMIIGNYDGNPAYAMELHSSGNLRTYINNVGYTSTAEVDDNKWHHVAAVRDMGNNVLLYVDGEEILNNGSEAAGAFTVAHNTMIGRNPSAVIPFYFDGKMDEVRIWNDARTQTEIQENMMKTLVGNEANLVAYYRFDQMEGPTLFDITSNSLDGTLTNMDDATDWVDGGAFSTWVGTESTDWATDGNWTDGSPAATQSAGIYDWTVGALTTYEATISGTPSMHSFFLSSTSTPVMSSSLTLGGSLILQRNLDHTSNNITFGSGNLVETNGTLLGTTGYIQTTRTLSGITSENVGNLGATITTAANMGSTNIKRGYSVQNGTGLSSSIKRYYDITPTTNTGLNATLVFNYLDGDLNGITENNLELFKSSDGGTTWSNEGGTVTTGSNTVTLTGIDGFSRWTAGVGAPEMAVKGNGTEIADGDATPATADHTDFSSAAVTGGIVERTFTIYNTGFESLTITTPITVTGDFSCTSQPATSVATSGNATFTIKFDPTATGTRSGTISIANNDPNENPYNFSIQGTGVSPEMDVKGNGVNITNGDNSPSTSDYTDFGNVDATSGTQDYSFTIENNGTDVLNITTPITVTGDFTCTVQPSGSLNAGANTTFTIRFDPTTSGTRQGTISISNDDLDENQYTFTIQGTGTTTAPTGKDTSITIAEGLSHIFNSDDFGYSDSDGDALYGIKIIDVISKGSLRHNGANVATNTSYNDVTKLVYQPIAGESGTPYTTFTYALIDQNNGISSTYTMTINVQAGDSPPYVKNPLPDITVKEENNNYTVRMDTLFTDPDNDDDDIVCSIISNSDTAMVGTSISGKILTLNFKRNKFGTAELIVQGLSNEKTAVDTFLVTVTDVNDAPTSSNFDITILENATYTFKVEDFPYADIENDIFDGIQIQNTVDRGVLKYWDEVVLVDKQYYFPTVSKLVFIPDTDTWSETYTTFEFKVRDKRMAFSDSTYTITINVRNVDEQPYVNSPLADIIVDEDAAPSKIMLDNLFADPDDIAIEKSAIYLSDSTLVSTSVVQDTLSITYLPNKFGVCNIVIKGQSNSLWVTDTMQVTVNPVNDAPTGENASITIAEATTHAFAVSEFPYSDVESDDFAGIQIVTLQDKGQLLYDNTAVVASTNYPDMTKLQFTPDNDGFGAPYTSFAYYLIDTGNATSDSAYTMTINVTKVDDPPYVANQLSDVTVDEDAAVSKILIDTLFADPDDAIIAKSVEANSDSTLVIPTIVADTLYLAYQANQYGTSELVIKGTSGGQSVNDTLLVVVNSINDLPIGGNATVTTDEEIAYTFATTDFPYSDIESDAFAGIKLVTLQEKGQLSYDGVDATTDLDCPDVTKLIFTPASNESGSPYTSFTYKVKDANDALSNDTYIMSITVVNINDAPVLAATMPDTTIFENTTLVLDYDATDADGDNIFFGMVAVTVVDTQLFEGMKMDSLTGEYSWTPTFEDAGVYAVGVYASDMTAMATDTFLITVVNVNRAPVFTSLLPDTTINNDLPFTFQYEAEDPDNDELTFGMLTPVDSLVFDGTGFLSWTLSHFTEDAEQIVSVYVTDQVDTAKTSCTIQIHNVLVAIDEGLGIPDKFELVQNYPNPFNPTTNIKYNLPKTTNVNISIYDISGKLVTTLVNQKMEAGYQAVTWDASNVSTGIYFYRIIAGDFIDVKKCLLVK